MYVQVVVELISMVTKKSDAQHLSYSDALSPLFETIVNIGTYGMVMGVVNWHDDGCGQMV